MSLTNTFVKNVKHTGAPSGDKHTDGRAMYLLVNAIGKYCRMNYHFADKRKTLALGVYPDVGLAKARVRRDKAARKIEARGSIDTAHRAKQICGQIFRYAVAVGLAERYVTTDLRGALVAIPESHFAAITEPKQAGELMRSIFDYTGHPCTVAALKLTPLVFVRPGELHTAE